MSLGHTEIDREEMINLVRNMIAKPSINPPGREGEVATYFAKFMRGKGFEVNYEEVKPERPNVFGVWRGQNEKPILLLNGHLDVVPPGQGWTIDPFKGCIKGGKIYGLGACDMKGGLAALASALVTLKKKGFKPKGTIILAAVCDEEMDQSGIKHLVKKGFLADYAVVGEPTNLRPVIAHQGRIHISITMHGKSAHASRHWLGINAIEKINPVIDKIVKYREELGNRVHPLLGSPSITVTKIKGGIAANIVPDRCTIMVDRRLIPNELIPDVKNQIKNIIPSLDIEDKDIRVNVDFPRISPALEIDEDTPIVSALRLAIKSLTGKDPGVCGMCGTTDAGFLMRDLNIPTVVFGPGNVNQAHAPDEYIKINDLIIATKVYAMMIENLMG